LPYTADLDYADFEADERTRRRLAQHGNHRRSGAQIPREVQAAHPDLPWIEMQTMRNIIIHEYHGVNLQIIWQTVKEDLPALVPLLEKILQK
jgi:uncharacterized protein with HEPN domain